LAAASYAQAPSAPAAPAAPATPANPPTVQTDDDQDSKEVQKEIEDARKEAEQAQREAQKEAESARREAQKEAYRARREAVREAAKARAEARKAARAQVVVMNKSYLGIGGHDVTPERANALKMKEPRGVEVIAVDQDSPAGKAGIKDGDVIVSFDSKQLDDYDDLRRLMRDTVPGKVVKLGVLRNGSPMSFNVTIARRAPSVWAWSGKEGAPFPPMPPIPPVDFDIPSCTVLQFSSRNGVMVEDITPQLGDFFGVKNGEGVLVRSVDRGSAAEASGLKAGDVIVRAGSDRIGSTSDWRRALREHKSGSLGVGIVRDKREQSLTLKLPSTTSDASMRRWPGFEDSDFEEFRLELQKMQPGLQKEFKIATVNMARELELYRAEIERAKTLRYSDFNQAREEAEKALKEAAEQLRELQQK
jgi:C-terminal processing protease CtpA/Prc